MAGREKTILFLASLFFEGKTVVAACPILFCLSDSLDSRQPVFPDAYFQMM